MFQLAEDKRRDLRWREFTVGNTDSDNATRIAGDTKRQKRGVVLDVLDSAPHETLHGINGARRLGQQTPLPFPADIDGVVLADRNNRRHQRVAVIVAHDDRPSVVDVRDQAVSRAEIDADDLAHGFGLTEASRLAPRPWSSDASRSIVASRLLM
jgi:hypothetical protein